jgi:hypothetical protein
MRRLTIVLAVAACGTPDPSGAPDAASECEPSGVTDAQVIRATDAGSVTVTALLENALEHCRKPELAFALVFDTHSVDLLAIDVVRSARVDTSLGGSVATGLDWSPASESSHHREGVLTTASPPLEGAAWLRLTIADVAGTDRIFEWDASFLAHDLP